MLKIIAAVCAAVAISAGVSVTYFERILSRERTAATHTLLEQRTVFMNAMQNMAPREEIDGALRALEDRASVAQSAILDSYVKVYCADHSHASAQEKQEAMDIAAILSGLASRAGVGDVALAEYSLCKPHP